MNSALEKWNENEKWHKNPSDGIALGGEVVYAKGNETIEASGAEDACRVILFYDKEKQKAALIHINLMNNEQYKRLIDVIKVKKFNVLTTEVFLCGDEIGNNNKDWNDAIEKYVKDLKYSHVRRITKGIGKNVEINPGTEELSITDDTGLSLV